MKEIPHLQLSTWTVSSIQNIKDNWLSVCHKWFHYYPHRIKVKKKVMKKPLDYMKSISYYSNILSKVNVVLNYVYCMCVNEGVCALWCSSSRNEMMVSHALELVMCQLMLMLGTKLLCKSWARWTISLTSVSFYSKI